jgi:exopolysaccharide production protein ExoQ
MTASWDSFGPPGARPRRIRGAEIPPPSAISWREQQRRARAQIAAQHAQARARAELAADPPELAFHVFGIGVDTDALFAFALFLPMLFLVQFGTLGAAMITGLTPVYLLVRRKRLARVLAPRAFLFAFPGFALLSVVWSETPTETLKFAVELWITVAAALLLSSARNQRAVLRAICLAFLIYVCDALATGGTVAVGVGAGGQAFSGLTDSKNLMAEIASTGLIVSIAVMFMSVADRKWMWVGVALLAAAVQLYSVFAARSAGAVLGLTLGLMPLIVLSPLVSAGKVLRAWLTSTVALVLVVGGLFFRTIAEAMISLGASIFDKDPTLTGRTYLWYRAFDLIRERPFLGRGYFSFWLQGNIDAEGLWRYAGILERTGFNFHNTLVDLLVTVGWIGAAVLIVLLTVGAFALVRKFVNQPSLPLVFWVSILLYEVSRTPIETVAIQPFYFSTTLVFGALGVAYGREVARRTAHRAIRSAVPVQVWPIEYRGEAWSNPRIAPAKGSLSILRASDTGKHA